MKQGLAIFIIVGFVLSPMPVIAKGGKGKGPNPSDKAYEKANENAKFLRGEDDVMGKGKGKGKNKEASFDDEKKIKEKKARYDKASKSKMKKAKERTDKETRHEGTGSGKAYKKADKMEHKTKTRKRGE